MRTVTTSRHVEFANFVGELHMECEMAEDDCDDAETFDGDGNEIVVTPAEYDMCIRWLWAAYERDCEYERYTERECNRHYARG